MTALKEPLRLFEIIETLWTALESFDSSVSLMSEVRTTLLLFVLVESRPLLPAESDDWESEGADKELSVDSSALFDECLPLLLLESVDLRDPLISKRSVSEICTSPNRPLTFPAVFVVTRFVSFCFSLCFLTFFATNTAPVPAAATPATPTAATVAAAAVAAAIPPAASASFSGDPEDAFDPLDPPHSLAQG